MHDIIKIINKGKNQNINWNIGINDESLNIKLSFTKPFYYFRKWVAQYVKTDNQAHSKAECSTSPST